MTGTPLENYHARMRRALDLLEARLDDPPGVDRLAEAASFSKFHFCRQFAALFGVAPHRYAQLARLKRASYALAFHDRPITEIALDAGYEAPDAFSRAFRARLGRSPSEFRREPDWTTWRALFGPVAEKRREIMPNSYRDADVEIVDFAPTPVAVMTHRGDPAAIQETIARFVSWRKAAGLTPPKSGTFNILHHDPETTDPADYRLDLCAETSGRSGLGGGGIEEAIIPGGRCARLRIVGAGDDLRSAALFLYGDWLPRSGEELRDDPLFVRRTALLPAASGTTAELYLPLK